MFPPLSTGVGVGGWVASGISSVESAEGLRSTPDFYVAPSFISAVYTCFIQWIIYLVHRYVH